LKIFKILKDFKDSRNPSPFKVFKNPFRILKTFEGEGRMPPPQ